MKSLFVGNLSVSATEAVLGSLFEAYGTVERVSIMTDRDTEQAKGFGFVDMSDDGEAVKAIAALNGKDVEGRTDPLAGAQRKRLIELYSIRSREYSEAVAFLGQVRDGIEPFRHALKKVESGRIACEQAYIKFHEHIAKHGFLVPGQ